MNSRVPGSKLPTGIVLHKASRRARRVRTTVEVGKSSTTTTEFNESLKELNIFDKSTLSDFVAIVGSYLVLDESTETRPQVAPLAASTNPSMAGGRRGAGRGRRGGGRRRGRRRGGGAPR